MFKKIPPCDGIMWRESSGDASLCSVKMLSCFLSIPNTSLNSASITVQADKIVTDVSINCLMTQVNFIYIAPISANLFIKIKSLKMYHLVFEGVPT